MATMTSRALGGLGQSRDEWAAAIEHCPLIAVTRLMAVHQRAVIVAPHPDDEVLGSGGLIALLALQGYSVSLMAVCDGTHSHPGSGRWTREKLARTRPMESEIALGRLLRHERKRLQVLRGGFEDGAMTRDEDAIARWIAREAGERDLLLAPFVLDGHPDHEAVSRATLAAARQANAGFVQIVIWASHWACANHPMLPWQRLHRVLLPPFIAERKRDAVRAFISQIEPDESTGRPAILPPQVLSRFMLPTEWLIV